MLYLLRAVSSRNYRIYTGDDSTKLNGTGKKDANGASKQREEKPPAWHLMCASLATFVFSGIMHEYFMYGK